MDRIDAQLPKAGSTISYVFISRLTPTNNLRCTHSFDDFIEIDLALKTFKTGTESAHKIQSYGPKDARLLKAGSTDFPIGI